MKLRHFDSFEDGWERVARITAEVKEGRDD